MANRLLQAWRESGHGTRSFSAGVAIHASSDLPEQTLDHADEAVRRAKRQGKNQVCLYPKGGWLGEHRHHATTAVGELHRVDRRPRSQ